MQLKNAEMGYLGNPNVKRDGVQQQFTQNEVSEYLKCMKDPIYFAKTYVKVISLDKGLISFTPYAYQEKMFDHFNANRFSIVLACRKRSFAAAMATRGEFIAALRSEMAPAITILQVENIAPVDMAQSAIGPGIGNGLSDRKNGS